MYTKQVEFKRKSNKNILVDDNIFTREKFKHDHLTFSGNGSIKLTTTGNPFIDDFASLSKYRVLRDPQDIFNTMEILWNKDRLLTLKETFYLRLITRDTRLLGSNKKIGVQIGTGLKHEFIYRLMWIADKSPKVFVKNIYLIPTVGSWYDIFQLLRIYYSYSDKGNFPINEIYKFIYDNLENSNEKDLIKKYLPTIKSKSHNKTMRNYINTMIGKHIAKDLYDTTNSLERYRQLKASGNAHEWEQKISQQAYNQIDFSKISGRALSLLTTSKFLENHNLEGRFKDWILKQPVAKFTGYPYELFGKSTDKDYKKTLINKQFLTLINQAPKAKANFIGVVDTSGSMDSDVPGTNVTAKQIALSMALYLSYIMEGQFSKTWLEFNSKVTIHSLQGKTPLEQFSNMNRAYYNGSTNFLGVAELFVALKKANFYSDDKFPTGIVCFSDGEFDESYPNCRTSYETTLTTVDLFKDVLLKGGFSENFVNNFTIILWDIPDSYYEVPTPKFESLATDFNIFHMSGLDPAGLSFILGTETKDKPMPRTPDELFETAMHQEILDKIKL